MRAPACVCVRARACVHMSIELAEASVVEETLCFHGDESPDHVQVRTVHLFYLLVCLLFCLLLYWFIVWMDVCCLFYWKTTEVAAESLSSKCLQTPAKRERERRREGGRRKRETEVRAASPAMLPCTRKFHPLDFHKLVFFFNSPVLRLYSSIFQKVFFYLFLSANTH